MPRVHIGIDVGGTFTDLVLVDLDTGRSTIHKTPSTPSEPHRAPIGGLLEICRHAGVDAADVGFVGLGTTVATNALIERKGTCTGLITTRGFRDLLEIARQKRPHAFDFFARKPAALVPRQLRMEVTERIAADGTVVEPLDVDEVAEAAARLRAHGAKAVVVCFLNAYVNPEHELLAMEVVRTEWEDAAVSTSVELIREFREYERLNSAVVNAYLTGPTDVFFREFGKQVRDAGIADDPPLVMTSAGSVATVEFIRRRPIETLFSGPSGGVSGAVHVGALAGAADVITFDMGGTSTDVAIVQAGRPAFTRERTVAGLPIKGTCVDIHTVGAGGGSVAWLDSGGMLRVGPHSVGSDPGPACFARGGDRPTVTDANVVLGRLDPEYLLDGALPISRAAAVAAIEQHIAEPRGIDVVSAAAAILQVATMSMAQAIRVVSVERGLDPSAFALTAYGGAGPLHAAMVGQEAGMRNVLVPPVPGVLSAMGVLTKDIEFHASQTHRLDAGSADAAAAVEEVFITLERRAAEVLAATAPATGLGFSRSADLRYRGQSHELTADVPADVSGAAALRTMAAAFHAAHERAYGYASPDRDVEIVTQRLVARVPIQRTELPAPTAPRRRRLDARDARRVYFDQLGGFANVPVAHRSELVEGRTYEGPCIVEQLDTTTVLPPGFTMRQDANGIIDMTIPKRV
jgi:N-methylhydantoinase A